MVPRLKVPNTFDPIDETIDEAWEPLRSNDYANKVFYAASEAANFSMLWHGLGLARAIILRDPKIALRISAALGIESALVNGPIKSLFLRERPDVEERPMQLRQPKTSSFPSGHASAAAVAAAALGETLTPQARRSRLALRGLAAIVATSRIHVQIHHATDVAAGAVTGVVLTKLMRPVLRRVFAR